MRILFIEDEKKITDALKELCRIQNIDCDVANDGEEGLLFALNPIYDVIVDAYRDVVGDTKIISDALADLVNKECIVYLRRSNNYLKLKSFV